jgi:hypothetical protein
LLTQIARPQQNAPLQNSKVVTTRPAAAFPKLLKLLQLSALGLAGAAIMLRSVESVYR